MTHFVIALDNVSKDRHDSYGVICQSRNVYRTGKSHGPTRVVVWDNLTYPNPDYGKKLGDTLQAGQRRGNKVTEYSLRYTEGRWLDPGNEPTDNVVSILLTPESSAICSDTSMNTGQPGSGQVYDNSQGIMRDGDTATLVYPNGAQVNVTLRFPPHRNGHGYAEFS